MQKNTMWKKKMAYMLFSGLLSTAALTTGCAKREELPTAIEGTFEKEDKYLIQNAKDEWNRYSELVSVVYQTPESSELKALYMGLEMETIETNGENISIFRRYRSITNPEYSMEMYYCMGQPVQCRLVTGDSNEQNETISNNIKIIQVKRKRGLESNTMDYETVFAMEYGLQKDINEEFNVTPFIYDDSYEGVTIENANGETKRYYEIIAVTYREKGSSELKVLYMGLESILGEQCIYRSFSIPEYSLVATDYPEIYKFDHFLQTNCFYPVEKNQNFSENIEVVDVAFCIGASDLTLDEVIAKENDATTKANENKGFSLIRK